MSIRLAHLSDLHATADPTAVMAGRRSAQTLKAVMDALAADGQPDLVVLTGDISDDASAESYRVVADLVRDAAPVVRWLAGNHDDPTAMEDPELLATGGASVDGWDYLPIDTFLPGKHYGGVGASQVSALDAHLASRAGRHVVIGIHHPPVHDVCPHPDCQVEDASLLVEMLAQHQSVRVVLSGHLHQEFDVVRHGIRFLGAPSTWLQIGHDGDPHYEPNGLPPAARELTLHEDGTFDTRVVTAAT